MQVQNVQLLDPLYRTKSNVGPVDLYWDELSEPVRHYRIYRAYTELIGDSPWAMIDECKASYYRDVASDKSKPVFYAVSALLEGGSETALSDPVALKLDGVQHMTQRIALEVTERANWAIRRFGEPVQVYMKRSSGVRCSCWNPRLGRSEPSRGERVCGLCQGTGFESGYIRYLDDGADPYVQWTEPGRSIVQDVRGKLIEAYPVAVGVRLPKLKSDDIIVRAEAPHDRAKIYGVDTVTAESLGAYFLLTQTLVLQEPPDDVVRIFRSVL